MSNEAQGLIRRVEMTAPKKPVLMAYANYVDELGYCWSGIDCIAFDTGFDQATVKRARSALIADGWLISKRRFGKSAVTRVNLAKAAAEGIDRRPRTNTLPELEFEDVSPAQLQLAHSAPNEQRTLRRTNSALCAEPSAQSAPLSISDPLMNPSLPPLPKPKRASDETGTNHDGKTEGEGLTLMEDPSDEAWELVAGLDFGRYRRPNQDQARLMAQLFDLGKHTNGLTLREVRRHAQAAINEAKKAPISYLVKAPHGALLPANLPVPMIKTVNVQHPEKRQQPANGSSPPAGGLTAEQLLQRGLASRFLPVRLRETLTTPQSPAGH